MGFNSGFKGLIYFCRFLFVTVLTPT